MNTLALVFLLSLKLTILHASPWDLDVETRNFLNSHIDEIHQKRNNEATSLHKRDAMIDYERRTLNINSRNCRFCQSSEKLKQFHLKKKWPDQPEAHCFGSTLFLIQYLLAHPQSITHSCKEILSEIQNESNFEELVHSFSMNQHSYYAIEDSQDPLELNPQSMKDYFRALIGTEPSAYHVLPVSAVHAAFDKATIYATLKSLPNQLIMIGYTDKKSYNHCIAVSTQPQKLFVFDSNLGMYQFPDLETLSWSSDKVLKECKFRWLATFPSSDQF
jgi:hypothetical protein